MIWLKSSGTEFNPTINFEHKFVRQCRNAKQRSWNASLTRSALACTLKQPVEFIDNGFGPVIITPLRDLFDRSEAIAFKARTPSARHNLRRWLFVLRGRQTPVLLPSWGRSVPTAGRHDR